MFRHAKAERDEKESLALEAARDTAMKRTQTKLPFKIASAITSPSSALEAASAAVSDAAAAGSVRTRDYDDDCSELLSIDECIEQLASKGLDTFCANKKLDVESNYDYTRFMLIYRYFILRRGTPSVEPLGKMEASRQATLVG